MIRIPGHPMYSVTDDGQIYSHHRRKFIRLTKRTYNGSGYLRVGLVVGVPPNKYKFFYVHQLVLLAFVGPYPDGHEIDHIDLDTGNNSLSNLRYVTHVENCRTRNSNNQFTAGRRRA